MSEWNKCWVADDPTEDDVKNLLGSEVVSRERCINWIKTHADNEATRRVALAIQLDELTALIHGVEKRYVFDHQNQPRVRIRQTDWVVNRRATLHGLSLF